MALFPPRRRRALPWRRPAVSNPFPFAERQNGPGGAGEAGGTQQVPAGRLARGEQTPSTPWAPLRVSPAFLGAFSCVSVLTWCPRPPGRGCTVPASRGSWPWTSVLPTPTRSSPVREPLPPAGASGGSWELSGEGGGGHEGSSPLTEAAGGPVGSPLSPLSSGVCRRG